MNDSRHIVFLDCDGVFADFITGILAALDYPYEGIHRWPFGRVFDIFPLIGTNWREASKHCDADFWANLPWTEDGQAILSLLWDRFLPEETMLLTKPMDNDGSYAGKARWVTEHIPELRKRMVPTHVEKCEFARGRGSLLLDDNSENCDMFQEAGGSAILVPRPWNRHDYLFYSGKVIEFIKNQLDKWMLEVEHPARFRGIYGVKIF